MTKYLFESTDWTCSLLEEIWQVIEKIGKDTFQLDFYPPRIEVLSSEQMLDNYTSNAMPIMYNHWSFGKHFLQHERNYKVQKRPLAFEVVINTNPSICYLMEDNTATMQCLTLAHAACGHSSFFKNNYLFQEWTVAEGILPYLKFARDYIQKCEKLYGTEEVECFLDNVHALQYNGIDKYKKPSRRARDEKKKKENREKHKEESFNDLWRTLPPKAKKDKNEELLYDPSKYSFPEENLLYFLEKHGRHLEEWQKEIIRIVRKISQYFYPQMQTKMMNEGWASYWHYKIMIELYDQEYISDGSYLEFIESHTSVLRQPDMSGINPYYLGFRIFEDIERICKNPTEEDKRWFPELIGRDWLEAVHEAMENYKDESFVLQYLSPKVIRDLKMCSFFDDEKALNYKVTSTETEEDVLQLRKHLSEQYSINLLLPHIEVVGFDPSDYETLKVYHYEHRGQRLDEDGKLAWKSFEYLWGDPCTFSMIDPDTGEIIEEIY